MKNGIEAFSRPDKEQISDMLHLQETGNIYNRTGYTADFKNGAFCPKSAEIVALERTGTPFWSSQSFKPGKQTKTNP